MSERYLVGVDIGTSASKGVLVSTTGHIVAQQSAEHTVESPQPGWYEHDADAVWWHDLKTILRALITQSGIDPRQVAAVGISALCPDMLPVDEQGNPLRKGILYSDSRAAPQIEQLVRRFSSDPAHRNVQQLSTNESGPKILWFRDNEPELFARTASIHTATSWLVFKLTGQEVVSYGDGEGYLPFFDSELRDWDRDMCRQLGIPDHMLPRLAWSTEIAGEVTPEAARATGLAEGTAVIVGTCDGWAEHLSVGVVGDGEASLLYGSTMCMGVNLSEQTRARLGSGALGALPGTYFAGFAMSTSGALTTWFRNNLADAERQAEKVLGINAYQLLSMEAAEIAPGSEGLVVLPYFAGERSPIYDSLARGTVLGLTLSHTRRHLYRALLEGVAYALRHNIQALVDSGVSITRIVATGGGTKSELWTQIVSDVIGMDQHVVLHPAGAPYGDAFLAGYATGIFNDLQALTAEGWKPRTRVVSCDPERHQVYSRYWDVYRGLYEKNKEAMHALAKLSALQA